MVRTVQIKLDDSIIYDKRILDNIKNNYPAFSMTQYFKILAHNDLNQDGGVMNNFFIKENKKHKKENQEAHEALNVLESFIIDLKSNNITHGKLLKLLKKSLLCVDMWSNKSLLEYFGNEGIMESYYDEDPSWFVDSDKNWFKYDA